MTTKSKALYLGNLDGGYCGFTVGKEYEVDNYITENDYIGVFGDDGGYRYIKNEEFHTFELLDEDDFVTETECAVGATRKDEKPDLRYYINGHEVGMIEFENVRYKVEELDGDGVKCDTIKFEVKFE